MLFAALLSTALAGSAVVGSAGPVASPLAVPDSAVEELRLGRYWHAARIMREEGVDTSDPAQALLLAEAEAGWHNWSGVVELLEGRSWLAEVGGGEGWYLLGRAHEEAGRWEDAAAAYRSFLPRAEGARRGVIQGRLARSLSRSGSLDEGLVALEELSGEDDLLRSWVAVELAGPRVEDGDTAVLSELMAHIVVRPARDAAWRMVPDARLEAGDSAGALAAFEAILAEAPEGRRGVEVTAETGLLRLALGDTASARPLLLESLGEAPRRLAGDVAAALLDLGGTDEALTLELAVALDRAGDGRRALAAYDRVARLAAEGGEAPEEWARLARARLMATVPSRRDEAIEEFRAIRETTTDDRVAARNLETWAGVRGRQGLRAHVSTLRRWLLEEHPNSPEAAEVLWDRANAADRQGDESAALELYDRIATGPRTHARAGQARMRTGQIHLGRGRMEEAAATFDAYLEDFPDGRRWQEAAYWSARSHMELGHEEVARERVERIRRADPISYYAVMGADLLGVPYQVDVPDGEDPVEPEWLTLGLERLDRLVAAGLERGAEAVEEALLERARGTPAVMLRVGEALIHRGRTITGINVGWELRGGGQAWDRRLLEVVYPFPYRKLVIREAEEWGVDPFMLAALIRQESAFKADIVSRAGAVGLMQVMPPTGRQLARAHGPDGFHEANLTTPEVNLHLGAAFFVEMNSRYGGDLPLVLSAYNAGPTRATRWRRYPEAADPLRFTERIPFDETRGYVKNVRRNLGLYQVLYGDVE